VEAQNLPPDDDGASFSSTIEYPSDITDATESYFEAERGLLNAKHRQRDAARQAARDLRGCGLSVRDAAHVMMVSTSWVNKLLKQAADE
jgi:hypothetical protein